MFFTRTYRFQSANTEADIKKKLLGNHVKVHDMDFEVSEQGRLLRIIPHAEEDNNLRTLPITHVQLQGKGGHTQIVLTSKMRKIDSGGPLLIVIFCMFMLIAALLFLSFGGASYAQVAYILGGVSMLIFVIFWAKMEAGYFDYVRKIRDYVKKQA